MTESNLDSNKTNKDEDENKEVCLVIAGNVDSGKCFGKGTKIMKFNGKLEPVENLKIGDLLMGEDSCPRKILETHKGYGQLYKIIISDGNNLVVNGEHILCLKSIKYNKIIEISVKEFLKLNKFDQNMLNWYRTGVNFNDSSVPLDPYIFGIWLADGYRPTRNTMNYLNIFKIRNKINNLDKYLENNFFKKFLEKNNLLNNKHVPDIYKYNSNKIRMQILAGLIDSDGYYYSNNSYSIRLFKANYKLIDDVIYLIRSLGFDIYNNLKINKIYNLYFGTNKENENYLPNRRRIRPLHVKAICKNKIFIKKHKFGSYYGFEVDGNKRFLLEDFTVSHNSTWLGVMINNDLDDGNGSARSLIAKHPHEVKTGKTSDISVKSLKLASGKEIIFADLPGHQPYLKTALFGITGYFPDYGILIIAANRGILPMTKEHLGIYLYMKIPFIILITRSDIAPENIYKNLIKVLSIGLKKNKKNPVFINSLNELESEEKISEAIDYTKMLYDNPDIIPIITISNKTGYYVNTVRKMIEHLKSRKKWEINDKTIFYIDSTFNPKGIGLVVSGLCKGKSIKTGDKLLIGPYNNEMISVRIWSIHDNNKNIIAELKNECRGCLAIHITDKKINFGRTNIKKGTVIINENSIENVGYQFKAYIKVLNHSTTIANKYSPVIHCGTIRQTARIILEDNKLLRMKDEDSVEFRFIRNPEFLEPEMKFFFREGTTRGIGTVTKILSIKEDPNPVPDNLNKRKHRKRFKKNKDILKQETKTKHNINII
ncbi:GTP-binding protein [uncultured virus]|nr:GTP-binding protein [uncultured virus]